MFTKEQYEVLAQTLSTVFSGGSWGQEAVIRWLWKGRYLFTPESTRSKIAFVRRPLSDMPLYINDDRVTFRTIAVWRLKISR